MTGFFHQKTFFFSFFFSPIYYSGIITNDWCFRLSINNFSLNMIALLFVLFFSEISGLCNVREPTLDAANQRVCIANAGTWDANTCTCRCSKACTTTTTIDALCNCVAICVDAAALTTRCTSIGGKFDANACQCITPPACDVQTLTARCTTAGGKFDATKCECVTPPACDVTAVTARCAMTNLRFDATTCGCLPATTCDVQTLTARCTTAGGKFDAAKCECITPPTCDVTAVTARCAMSNLAFDATLCACATVSACSATDLNANAVNKRLCTANSGVWSDSTCVCTCTKDCKATDRVCTCATTPTCDVTAVTARCAMSNLRFDANTCGCLQVSACVDAAALTTRCTTAGGKFDPTTCQCITPTQCDVMSMTARCVAANLRFDANACACLQSTTCDVQTLSARCTTAGGKFDETKCQCTFATTCDVTALTTRCTAIGGKFDAMLCTCTPPAATCTDLSTRCASVNGKFDSTTCQCTTPCDVTAMKQRCASANLLFLADACTCSTATTCDAMRLASACAGIKNAQPNVASCICEIVCADGSKASDAANRCALSGGVVTDFNSCLCGKADACSLQNLDAAAAEKRCVTAGYEFDRQTCRCVPKQVVCNTDVKCAYKMDPTTCQCVPAPCALTADRASAAVLACNAAGFRFDDSTCSCVKLCVSGDFAGVSIDAAVMRCSAANGVFVNTDGACSCKIPTSTCTTRTACDPGRVFNPKSCQCEDGCPDGRLYSDAKAGCVGAADSMNQWDPNTCSCTRTCSGDLATSAKTRCDSVKGTFDAKTCGCTLPKCDLTTSETAQIRSACALQGWIFNQDCKCTAPTNEPTCKDGGDYAALKARCLSTAGNSWDPATCGCRMPCFARDASTAANMKCADTQVFDSASCACIEKCDASKRYDQAVNQCRDGSIFDRTTCTCVAAPCNPRAESTQTDAVACQKNGGTFDYLACKCKQAQMQPTCSDEQRTSLRTRCASQMWTWDDATCQCSSRSQINVKLNTNDVTITNEFLQRLQLLARACNVKVDTSVAGTVKVQFNTGGADALNCVVDNNSIVKTLAADGAVSDVSVEALMTTEVPAMPSSNSSASTIVVTLGAFVVALIVASL